MMPLIKYTHSEAYELLESLRDVHFVTKPLPYAGLALHTAWYGYQAKKHAYRSLHSRDRSKAYAHLNLAKMFLDKYKQGSHHA